MDWKTAREGIGELGSHFQLNLVTKSTVTAGRTGSPFDQGPRRWRLGIGASMRPILMHATTKSESPMSGIPGFEPDPGLGGAKDEFGKRSGNWPAMAAAR